MYVFTVALFEQMKSIRIKTSLKKDKMQNIILNQLENWHSIPVKYVSVALWVEEDGKNGRHEYSSAGN